MSNVGIHVDWIKHIKSKEDQQTFVDSFSNSAIVDRLKEILRVRLADKSTFKEVDYSSPSWAYLAADRQGYIRAMTEMLSLLTTKERPTA